MEGSSNPHNPASSTCQWTCGAPSLFDCPASALGTLELGTVGVAVATVTGKPLGILAATGLALAAGLHLPQGVGWRELVLVGLATAIGFSVGLFFSAAMFPAGQLLLKRKWVCFSALRGRRWRSWRPGCSG